MTDVLSMATLAQWGLVAPATEGAAEVVPPEGGVPLQLPQNLIADRHNIMLVRPGLAVRLWGQTFEEAHGHVDRNGQVEQYLLDGTLLRMQEVQYHDQNDTGRTTTALWESLDSLSWLVARYNPDPLSQATFGSVANGKVIEWRKVYGLNKGGNGTFQWWLYLSVDRPALDNLPSPTLHL